MWIYMRRWTRWSFGNQKDPAVVRLAATQDGTGRLTYKAHIPIFLGIFIQIDVASICWKYWSIFDQTLSSSKLATIRQGLFI